MSRIPDPAKEQFWREHHERQAVSGLSVRAYCCSEGLKEHSFHEWRRVIRRRDGERGSTDFDSRFSATNGQRKTTSFVPVTVAASKPMIELVHPCGAMIRLDRGFDSHDVARLLDVLDRGTKVLS